MKVPKTRGWVRFRRRQIHRWRRGGGWSRVSWWWRRRRRWLWERKVRDGRLGGGGGELGEAKLRNKHVHALVLQSSQREREIVWKWDPSLLINLKNYLKLLILFFFCLFSLRCLTPIHHFGWGGGAFGILASTRLLLRTWLRSSNNEDVVRSISEDTPSQPL